MFVHENSYDVLNNICTICQEIDCACEHFQNIHDNSNDTIFRTPESINSTNLGLNNKKGLTIGCLNIAGLSSKFDEFRLMLTSKKNKIDIMGISETKFNENHKTETFLIDGYQIPFRRDRLFNGGGGLAVYVKQNINCKRRSDLEDDDIEIIWLEIMPIKCKSFLIGSIYRHPESKVAWREKFDTHLEKVQLEEKEILILGDVNRD